MVFAMKKSKVCIKLWLNHHPERKNAAYFGQNTIND